MGTVMNGNVWAGACVNGKVVSGLVKNGVVFYRMPVSTYRRRIMVGDSLGGKDIYNDFPTGYYSTFPTGTNSFTTLVESNGAPLIYENVINSPQDIEVASDEMVRGYSPYHYVDGEETISEKMTIDDYDTFDVTNITDNSSYRHLFIEDENIRPLEVGDVITSTTKFYFTFPDDFHVDIQSMTDENRDKNFIELDDGSDYVLAYVVDEYRVDFFTNNFSAQDYGVCYAYDRNTGIRINLSSKLAKDITDPWGNPFTGTVTMVDKNNEAYQHILVDATTLGA